jgi:hypothetical protein
MGTAFDPSSFTALGRLTGLVLAPDGRRLVAVRQEPDARGARYVSSPWGIDPDGALLFVSGRGEEDDEAAQWRLPVWGEAAVVARLPGGVSAPVVARESGRVVLSGSRLTDDRPGEPPDDPGDPDEAGRAARKDRRERKLTHVLHDGFPIRHWDHELGDVHPRGLPARARPAPGPVPGHPLRAGAGPVPAVHRRAPLDHTPGNARTWYETVLGFVGERV